MYLDIVTHTVQRLTDRGPAGFASLRRLGSITAQEQPSSCVSFPVSLVVVHQNLYCTCICLYIQVASREGYLTKIGKLRKVK